MAQTNEKQARPKSRLVGNLLLIIGVALFGTYGYQTYKYRTTQSNEDRKPTGEIMSGLDKMDRIPLEAGAAKDYNLIVITMDTTRADHIGCYGNEGVKTPVLDGMAREGVLFAEAFTPSPSTLPGHSSIFTGMYPYKHGARANGSFHLKPEQVTLAEILKEEGYATGAIISAYVLDGRFGLDQGFDTYNDDLTRGVKHGRHMFRERPGELTNEEGFKWLDENGKSRFFLWLHYFDVHAPYLPPEPYRTDYKDNLYDGEIAYVDEQIGNVLKKLEELGVREKTIVVVAGDHGEGLGEHGEQTHSMLIYDATLHTPLIWHCPGLFNGDVVYDQVSNVDIVPTALALLGIDASREFDGTSLLLPAEQRPKHIYAETISTLVLHGWSPLFGVRCAEDKYIHAPTPEYYDMIEDPGELENLFEQRPEQSVALSNELNKHVGDDLFGKKALAQAVKMDPEVAKKLADLGYVGSDTGDEIDAEAAAEFDPKDMIYQWESVQHANNLVSAGQFQKGLELLESAVKEVPNDLYSKRCLVSLYTQMGRREEALALLKQVLERERADPGIYAQAARLHMSIGEYEEAEALLAAAASIEKDFPGILTARAAIAASQQKTEEADRLFRKAIEMDPGTTGPGAYCELGNMYMRLLDYEKARAAFEAAIELDAFNGSAHTGLANILVAEDKIEEAEETYAKAIRFNPNQPFTLACLAGLYDKRGRFEVAKQLANRALAIQKDNAPALNNLALVHKHTGDMQSAKSMLEKLLEISPGYLAARVNLALCHLAEQEEDKAFEQFKTVLEINGNVPQALANVGVYHANHGEPQKARAFLQRAIRVDPQYAPGQVQYGTLLLQLGQAGEALKHLKKGLELDPDQPGHERLEHLIRSLEDPTKAPPSSIAP